MMESESNRINKKKQAPIPQQSINLQQNVYIQ